MLQRLVDAAAVVAEITFRPAPSDVGADKIVLM